MDKYADGEIFSMLILAYYGIVAFFTLAIVIFVGCFKIETGINWFITAIFCGHRIAMFGMAIFIITRLM